MPNLSESPYRITERVTLDARYAGGEYRFWVVSGTDRNGQRIRKSFADRQEAETHKARLDIAHWNQGAGMRHVVTDLTDAQLAECRFAITRLNGQYSLSDAVTFFLRHHADTSAAVPLSRAVVAYTSGIDGHIRPRTMVQKASILRQFQGLAGGDMPLHELSTDLVLKFLNKLRDRDGVNAAKPKTWNNARVDLLGFFEWCRLKPRQWVRANPVADIPPRLVEVGEIKVLDFETSEKLMRHVENFADGKLVPYFALCLFAGIRPAGELTKLATNPRLIDLESGFIRITPEISKTKRARRVRIRPNLAQWLTRFPGPILPTNHDREVKKVRSTFGLSHDVLRHTFISALVVAEGSFADAAVESGNSERIIRDHYFGALPKSEAEKFWSITPAVAGALGTSSGRSANGSQNRPGSPNNKASKGRCVCE